MNNHIVSKEYLQLTEQFEENNERKRSVRIYSSESFTTWFMILPPEKNYSLHKHLSDESFIVIEGNGILKDESGNTFELKPHSVVCIPANTYYSVSNLSTYNNLICFGNRAESAGGPHIKRSEAYE